MKHILNIRATALSLLFIIISASFTPAQAGLTNSNQDFLLSGKIFLDGNLATFDSKSLGWFSVGAGDQGSISKTDGTYSIKVAGDVKLISFCYTSKGDMPYNTNSSHCSYLETALVTNNPGVSPSIYNYDYYFNKIPGRMITGSITSPEKKVNGSFITSYIKVYSKQGILESMNVFGNKYQISIPSVANRITFCKAGMECIELDPKSTLFNSSNAILTFNLNFKKSAVVSSDKVPGGSSIKNTKILEVFMSDDVGPEKKYSRNYENDKGFAYTVNSRYNPSLGCVNLNSTSLIPQANLPLEDGYLCNVVDFTVKTPVGSTSFYTDMQNLREEISTLRKPKIIATSKSKKVTGVKLEIDEFTTAIAVCNIEEVCKFVMLQSFDFFDYENNATSKKYKHNRLKYTLPLLKNLNSSNSKFIFSKFNDGQKDLSNFISEIDTIKYISAFNTTLSEIKPRLSPYFISNYYLSDVPIGASKIEICTIYQYCFTTIIEESIAQYVRGKNTARTFVMNITDNNLLNYKNIGVVVENANFTTDNFDKALTIKYYSMSTGYPQFKRLRIGTSKLESQIYSKINKDFKDLKICDDTQCLPATDIGSMNCPSKPDVCLSVKFIPLQRSKILYAKLIHADGTPAPYAALMIQPNSNQLARELIYDSDYFLMEPEAFAMRFMRTSYQYLPEYKKYHTYYADENGLLSFALDLDHYYNRILRCNMNVCTGKYDNIFDQSSFSLPEDGKQLLITVPTEKFELDSKGEPPLITLKPAMKFEGQLLTVTKGFSKSPALLESSTKYLMLGSYLRVSDSNGNIILKSDTNSEGKFSINLNTKFAKLEVCSATNQCHEEKYLNKYYYLTLDEKEILTNKLFTIPAPKDKIGLLRGLFYNEKKKKIIANSKVYLFNAQNKLVGTLPTNSKGEFTKNLNYIQYNKVTRIQSCQKIGECDYNEIRLAEVQKFIDAQINYPFQVVSYTHDRFAKFKVDPWMLRIMI